jgi:hypothetical protein
VFVFLSFLNIYNSDGGVFFEGLGVDVSGGQENVIGNPSNHNVVS